MGKKNDSTIVAGAGFIADFFLKLRADVIELGGSDENLVALDKGDGRSTIRKMAELVVKLGIRTPPRTLAEMIKAGRYDWNDQNINEKNFPVKPELFIAKDSRLFCFNRVMTTAEVEEAIRSEGYDPDPIEKLLAYGAANPEEQRKYPIVGLGSGWVGPLGNRGVPCLCESGGRRFLDLNWDSLESQWYGRCRFLASRKSSA